MMESKTENVLSPIDIPESEKQEIIALYPSALLSGSNAQLTGPDGVSHRIPRSVYRLLVQILKDLSEGASVALFQEKHGLTTSQAGRMLGMSRQFFVNLLEQGEIPFTTVGKHRRVRANDVLAYKNIRDKNRRATLDQMLESEIEAGAGDATLDDYSSK